MTLVALVLGTALPPRGGPSSFLGVFVREARAGERTSSTGVNVERLALRPERSPLDVGVAVVGLSPRLSDHAGASAPKEVIGLYYFRNRYLDPEQGRFVSRDPIGIWGDPGNLGNGYAFCGGNPVNFRDPFGLAGKPWIGFRAANAVIKFLSNDRLELDMDAADARASSITEGIASVVAEPVLAPTDAVHILGDLAAYDEARTKPRSMFYGALARNSDAGMRPTENLANAVVGEAAVFGRVGLAVATQGWSELPIGGGQMAYGLGQMYGASTPEGVERGACNTMEGAFALGGAGASIAVNSAGGHTFERPSAGSRNASGGRTFERPVTHSSAGAAAYWDPAFSLPPYEGGETVGHFWTPDEPLGWGLRSGMKGKDGVAGWDMPPGSPGFDSYLRQHVEGGASAIMHRTGARVGYLRINNPTICDKCHQNLARSLPRGSTLYVETPDGVIHTFQGPGCQGGR